MDKKSENLPKLDNVPAEGSSAQPVQHDYHMRIAADGRWYHEGRVIERLELVKLFATVLSRDEGGTYWLRTPVEYGEITVEDAPFVITAVEHDNDGNNGPDEKGQFVMTDNIGRAHFLGPDKPLIMLAGPNGDMRPYVMIEKGLSALVSRPVFYQLVEHSVPSFNGDDFGVFSGGMFFALHSGKTEQE